MSDVEQRLMTAIATRRGTAPDPGARLTSLGIDSVEMAGFIREIEDTFDIEVDETVFDLQTVGELVRYVERRMPA